MFQILTSLISLAVLTLVISLLYFYIFKKNNEKYISYWALSWTMYTISLVFSIFLLKYPGLKLFIALKQVSDLFSSLFLLAGTYVFIDKKIPTYWIQFTLVNLIWIGLSVYYDLSFITITLLTSVFFNIIAIVTGSMLLRHWEMNIIEKFIIVTIFFVWGFHKAYYQYLYPGFWNSPLGYMSEIILANILNFCILIIYLQKIRKELDESEKRFRLLAENAQDLIYLFRFKPNLIFEYVSPSSSSILGYTPNEFYDNPNFFEKLVHPDDKLLFNILKEPNASLSEPIVLRFLHKDGHYIWIEQHTTVITDATGNIIAIEGIIRNITDRKLVEQKMIQAEKSRQSLLANISHELRTPITSILGYVTALKDGTISETNSKKNYFDLIYNKTLRLQHIVQDLFQLTQFESGRISFNFSQISICELIDNVINKYKWDVRHAGINFNLETCSTNTDLDDNVIVDIERIDQVFSNLIFNAIKHTPECGTISISFKKELRNSIEIIIIKIQDTGIGISKKDAHHIFDRFYRAKNANNLALDGSGLGLTISKEIIEFHKGTIWVESEPKKGSSFFFTLPIFRQ